ncbi:MFS transporter [Rhodopila sp.]|uniref:MFS transporter n=1 Tax=Rhodopila sp. TaxID=2480087 RepID=UPI003D0FA477
MVSSAVAAEGYDSGGIPGEPRAERPGKQVSWRSLRGLDALNFLMADVQGGLGPYLTVFLADQRWQPGSIGLAMAASSIAAAVCQIPAGLVVDATPAKRLVAAASGLLIAAACLLIAWWPHFFPVLGAQLAIGAAAALVPPTLAALALGLAGRTRFDATISRTQSFNHGGNFVAAALAGTLGHFIGILWIFYLICAFAAASALSTLLIKPAEIDHALARGGEAKQDGTGQVEPVAILTLLKRRDLLVFFGSVTLFHFGNAAMLPMAGQVLARAHADQATIALSACIIMAQFVMVGVAWAVGRAMMRGIGRKPIFLVAYALLPVRGVLFSFTTSPYGVVGIQVLDGVAAGVFGVVSVLIASDLMRGTGRFNLAQGLVALCVGIGAGLSNVVGEYAVQWFGYATGFLTLAGLAVCALLFFAFLMPETRSRTQPEAQPSGGAT